MLKNTPSAMDHAFITDLETWGSGGEMLDVLTLGDGRLVAITANRIALYDDTAAFEEGRSRGAIEL